jgi:hypothetical protein
LRGLELRVEACEVWTSLHHSFAFGNSDSLEKQSIAVTLVDRNAVLEIAYSTDAAGVTIDLFPAIRTE